MDKSLTNFFRHVLPEHGRYLMRTLPRGQNQFYNSIPELVHAAEARRELPGQYFTVASLGKDDNGAAANVIAMRSHRLDIDAGGDKFARDPDGVYPDRDAAWAATADFVRLTQLRPTFVVSSGAGLHLYFCLSEDVTPDEWLPVANLLKRACKAIGFKADPTCTADAARILRVPECMHTNGNRVTILRAAANAVYTNDEFGEVLSRFAPKSDSIDDILPRRARGATVGKRDVNEDIISHDDRPPSLARVATQCAAVRMLQETAGNLPEPHWRAVIGIAKYCPDDGETLAHEWSSGYDGYTYDETQAKLDAWTTPPTTCRHFDTLNKACESCPHRGKITTPLQLGRQPTVAVAAPPMVKRVVAANLAALSSVQATVEQPIPGRKDLFSDDSPFFFQKDDAGNWQLWHGNKVKEQDEDGDDVFRTVHRVIANRVFYIDYVTTPGEDANDGVQLKLVVVLNAKALTTQAHRLDASDLYDAKVVIRKLLAWGIVPESSNAQARDTIHKYLLMEYRRMSDTMRPVSRGRFGFQQHDGQTICTIGNSAIFPDGHIEHAMYGRTLTTVGNSLGIRGLPRNDTGHWPPDVFEHIIEPNARLMYDHLATQFAGEDNAIARLALSIGMAGPMMAFTSDTPYTDQLHIPPNGMVVSLYSSGSGKGKTGLLHTIALAYGDVSQVRGGARSNMTAVSGDSLAKVTAMFPFMLDEVTQNEAPDVGDTIYRFANGQGRTRSGQDGSVMERGTWALPCLLSTNIPQRELLRQAQTSGTAIDMRLLELNFDGAPNRDQNDGWRSNLQALSIVAGAWGAVFLRRALANIDATRTQAQANVSTAFDLLGRGTDYRFFARSLASVLTMFDLMADMLPFNREEVIKTYIAAVDELADTVPVVSAGGTFNDFVSQMSDHIAITQSMNPEAVILNANRLRAPLMGRYVLSEQVLWVSPKALSKYCQDMKLSKAQIEKDWAAAGLIVANGASRTWKFNPFRGLPTTARESTVYRCNMRTDSATGTNVVPLSIVPPTNASEATA